MFSAFTEAAASFPAWRMVQPARGESNSFVKSRGSGVGVNSIVGVGAGVSVKGTGVGVSVTRIVGVPEGIAAGVGVACPQAVSRRRHPIRNFFIVHIKT